MFLLMTITVVTFEKMRYFFSIVCFLWASIAGASKIISFSESSEDNYHFFSLVEAYEHASCSQKLNVYDVLGSLEFTSLNSTALNKGPSSNFHWIKFSLKNDFSSSQEIFFTLKNSAINSIRFYLFHQGKVDSCITGDRYPFEMRAYSFCNFTFPMTLNPGEKVEVLMELDKRNENFFCAFDLRGADDFHAMEIGVYLTFGIFSGIILLSILLNLFLYVSIKDVTHLWYSIYAFSNLLLIFAYDGLDFQFFYPNSPFFSNVSRYISTGTTYMLLFKLLQVFVLDKDQFSRIRWYSRMMISSHFVLIVSSLIIFYFHDDSTWLKILLFRVLSILGLISMISLIVLTFYNMRKGSKHGLLFLVAVSILFLGAIEYTLNVNGWMTGLLFFRTTIPSNLQLFIVIEVLLVFIAIAFRFKQYRQDSLELKLALVSTEARLKGQELRLVDQERKRIGRDLHDGVGSVLFGARMKVQSLLMKSSAMNVVMKEVSDDLDSVSDGIRRVIWQLNQNQAFDLMLKDLVDHARGTLAKRDIQISVDLTLNSEIVFKDKFKRDFFLLFMEICNNTYKYSKAKSVVFELGFVNEDLIFSWKERDMASGRKELLSIDSSGVGLESISDRIKLWSGVRVDVGYAFDYDIRFSLSEVSE